MKLLFNPVPFVAMNLTDGELCRLIGHHYPNLQGPLLVAVERLAKRADTSNEQFPQPLENEACPHCGSEYVESTS
jgi:hypothetical protein